MVADCAGMHGVIITKRRCTEVTAATVKTSAGSVFHVPIAQVANLVSVIKVLKKEGLWVMGMDTQGAKPIYEIEANFTISNCYGSRGEGFTSSRTRKL